MTPQEKEINDLKTKVAVLGESERASATAVKLAADALDTYKTVSDAWRQALSDQRAMFVTRPEAIAIVTVGMGILGLILKFIH